MRNENVKKQKGNAELEKKKTLFGVKTGYLRERLSGPWES